MAYRKLNRETRQRRSILAGLTKTAIMNESVVTTEARAKEVRKFVDKMITYGKRGTLVSRRKALAFLHNDKEVVNKVFNDLAKRYEERFDFESMIDEAIEKREVIVIKDEEEVEFL